LVEPNDADNLTPELEGRLDDLFDEHNASLPDNGDRDGSKFYPLAELKNLILSIDWEITDEVLEKLLQQIQDLNMTYGHDKTVLSFLQILDALGGYIKKNRAKAHPKTFKTLNSVFASLDKVVLSKDMAETEKKKILSIEMNQYNELRIQIAQSKAEKKKNKLKSQEPKSTAPESFFQTPNAAKEDFPNTEQGLVPSTEALAKAVEEIKQYIHAEIEALKTEIKSLL
jgi:hypothetical protein